MSTDIDSSFPHRFTCEVLDELPGGPAGRRYVFPLGAPAGQDGVLLRVQPDHGEPWIGMFAFGKVGKTGFDGVLAMPDPDKVCVVARGAAYIVRASDPTAWEPVGMSPVTDVRAAKAAGLVIFADYTELLAYSESGVKWRTKRLAWDGLKIVAVDDRTIVGEYPDLGGDETRRFEVDLATGTARGGVET
jgi:hypothetical protein